MNAVRLLYLVAWLSAGIALAVVLPANAGDSKGRRVRLFALALAALTLALLCVGVVSHTMLRHVVQVAPVILALVLLLRGSPHGAVAGIPLLSFWLGIMASIWLFLLGVARIFSGRFTPVEIALTIVIGVAAGCGLLVVPRTPAALSIGRRLLTALVFSVLQFGALWLSMQPFVATR